VKEPLRLLLAEDSEDDAILVALALEQHGFELAARRVADAGGLRAALASEAWDVVVSDYSMPGFGGLQALALVREMRPDLPFVLVSAAIGEDTAVDAMKAGAADYVMKGNLARLGPAVERELREAATRREKRAAERTLAHLGRVREVMSALNATMVRACDREELYRQAASVLVRTGGFRLAWIGIRGDAGALVVQAVEAEEAGGAEIADDDCRDAAGDAVRALESGLPAVTIELAATEPGRFDWAARGMGSRMAIPIGISGRAEGVLVLYARDPLFFDEQETRLIRELAADLSFGLDHIGRKERLDFLAYSDPATGPGNRSPFPARPAQRVAASIRARRRLAVAVIDIDRFRLLNESMGRHVGDRLLRRIGERIVRCVQETQVAHIGSGHFAVVLEDVEGMDHAARLVRGAIADCFADAFFIDGAECRVSARAGLAFFPDDHADPARLLRNAESAAERAKERSDPCVLYTEQMTAQVSERVLLENRLLGALARREFEVFYQPKVAVRGRRLVSVEALLRWRPKPEGLVLPGGFISVLEETGLVCDVGDWVLARARRDRAEWLANGLPAPRIAVNVSVKQLALPDFIPRLAAAIGERDGGIDLEVTESVLMDDVDGCIGKLEQAHAMGANIAIDDFGTGYSSLAYLARLPVQALKIDRAFVSRLDLDGQAHTMTGAIVSIARSLGLSTIAEGVETEGQARVLEALGCDEMQGFLTGRPVPFAELSAMLESMAPAAALGA